MTLSTIVPAKPGFGQFLKIKFKFSILQQGFRAALVLSPFLFCTSYASAQTWAEQLGYPKDARVLILHVDDAGMSLDSNEGAIKAMTEGVATSVSVMMPCPWVPGFVSFLKQHPLTDAGLHLTLTSEWDNYRWGPLAGKPAVPG
ncbi:MAG TPA: ChbG/HpnK family deacetylase, partial [Chryseolinea sp.]|nr:ChbG/HpnK family deacetylase [Chryseolinea sp.]